jgi:pyridoxal 5'-phosphate synthase pdxT subunit
VKIGVLALQGAFREHVAMVERCGMDAGEVRTVEELDMVDGLIIPGGESTTVGKLMCRYGLDEAIRMRVSKGMPLFGTCMGLILMATDIEGNDQFKLGVMDISVRRNAFGRQVDSFECDLTISELGPEPLRAVFIRAPYVVQVHNDARIMAMIDDRIVLVRQNHLLAAAFHPELTEDTRIHDMFIDMVLTAGDTHQKIAGIKRQPAKGFPYRTDRREAHRQASSSYYLRV